ncbi:MAG TPA: hypothetical protein VFT98_07590 [Myxococcota bacterium]|nr:hypothetical protein [Myxococcota bacterium]
MQTRVVYLAPDEFDSPPPPFRVGAGGRVWLSERGELETDERVRLSANTVHALEGHGVLVQLNRLRLELGPLGGGRQALVPQAALAAAAEILTEADRKTYGAQYEFVVARANGAEYRVRVENREYQRALARLRDLIVAASRQGFAVWLRI